MQRRIERTPQTPLERVMQSARRKFLCGSEEQRDQRYPMRAGGTRAGGWSTMSRSQGVESAGPAVSAGEVGVASLTDVSRTDQHPVALAVAV